MTEIHLTQQLESDTLRLPELRPLIGKKVEIIVREMQSPQAVTNGWEALLALAQEDLIDLDTIEAYREFDKKSWRVNSP